MIPLLQVRKIAARTLFLIPQVFPRGWGDSHRWSWSNELVLSWWSQKALVGTEQGESLGREGWWGKTGEEGTPWDGRFLSQREESEAQSQSYHVLCSYLSLTCPYLILLPFFFHLILWPTLVSSPAPLNKSSTFMHLGVGVETPRPGSVAVSLSSKPT